MKFSKNRALANDILSFMREKKVSSKPELRKHFERHAEGLVRYSLSCLVHKKLVKEDGAKLILTELAESQKEVA